jgi:hypothetical protein
MTTTVSELHRLELDLLVPSIVQEPPTILCPWQPPPTSE